MEVTACPKEPCCGLRLGVEERSICLRGYLSFNCSFTANHLAMVSWIVRVGGSRVGPRTHVPGTVNLNK